MENGSSLATVYELGPGQLRASGCNYLAQALSPSTGLLAVAAQPGIVIYGRPQGAVGAQSVPVAVATIDGLIRDLAWAPSHVMHGRALAVGLERRVEVWECPAMEPGLTTARLVCVISVEDRSRAHGAMLAGPLQSLFWDSSALPTLTVVLPKASLRFHLSPGGGGNGRGFGSASLRPAVLRHGTEILGLFAASATTASAGELLLASTYGVYLAKMPRLSQKRLVSKENQDDRQGPAPVNEAELDALLLQCVFPDQLPLGAAAETKPLGLTCAAGLVFALNSDQSVLASPTSFLPAAPPSPPSASSAASSASALTSAPAFRHALPGSSLREALSVSLPPFASDRFELALPRPSGHSARPAVSLIQDLDSGAERASIPILMPSPASGSVTLAAATTMIKAPSPKLFLSVLAPPSQEEFQSGPGLHLQLSRLRKLRTIELALPELSRVDHFTVSIGSHPSGSISSLFSPALSSHQDVFFAVGSSSSSRVAIWKSSLSAVSAPGKESLTATDVHMITLPEKCVCKGLVFSEQDSALLVLLGEVQGDNKSLVSISSFKRFDLSLLVIPLDNLLEHLRPTRSPLPLPPPPSLPPSSSASHLLPPPTPAPVPAPATASPQPDIASLLQALQTQIQTGFASLHAALETQSRQLAALTDRVQSIEQHLNK